jgi:hypothetical protein
MVLKFTRVPDARKFWASASIDELDAIGERLLAASLEESLGSP